MILIKPILRTRSIHIDVHIGITIEYTQRVPKTNTSTPDRTLSKQHTRQKTRHVDRRHSRFVGEQTSYFSSSIWKTNPWKWNDEGGQNALTYIMTMVVCHSRQEFRVYTK